MLSLTCARAWHKVANSPSKLATQAARLASVCDMKHSNPPPVAPVLFALIVVSLLWVSYWGADVVYSVAALGVFAIPVVVVFGMAGLMLAIRRLFRRH